MLNRGEPKKMIVGRVVCGYHAFDKSMYETNVRLAGSCPSPTPAGPLPIHAVFFGLFKRKEQRFADPEPLLNKDIHFSRL